MSAQTLFLDFDGLSQPIALTDCAELLAFFPRVFLGPVYREGAAPAAPAIALRRQGDRYLLTADWLEQPIERDHPVDMVCAFLAELAQAYLRCNPNQLWLHAAAAEFSGRLVVFPNTYRAGKSLLSACLASGGVGLFADDVLPLDLESGRALAPGFQPRLRLPLPDDLSPESLVFFGDRQGPQSRRYRYLGLRDGELARKGKTATIGAFVQLRRRDRVKAQLTSISASEALRDVIWQNFARGAHSSEILRHLHILVAGAQCLRLDYSRAEDAVEVLKAQFMSSAQPQLAAAVSPHRAVGCPVERPAGQSANCRPAARARSLPAGCYCRDPQVQEITLDGERFLSDPRGESIFHLNPVGSSLWQLLREPVTLDEMVTLLCSAFPDISRQRIRNDVSTLVDSLADRGLVVRGLSCGQARPETA